MKIGSLAFCAVLAATPVCAAGTLKGCMAAAKSTKEMQDCQQAALTEVDGRLDAAYRGAMAGLPADQKAKLRDAERLWAQFRLADCGAFYGTQSGTVATIRGGRCMINRAEHRIADLREFGAG